MSPKPGRVVLVGAGPGPADLLTLRAMREIQTAEALLYDALVADEVIQLAPAACLKLQTGKRSGRASMEQEVINQLMLRLAHRGLKVVRLKGGDPSVFGRSGEERSYLEARGIAVEIVPGITAVSAAAAQFAFPLTHRGEARRLVLATVRTAGGEMIDQGWPGLADEEATLAVYMGRDCAHAVARRLIADGLSPSTPALAVENAGHERARLVGAPLSGLGDAVDAARFTGPVLLVIGKAAGQARITDRIQSEDFEITRFG
jgi:uroporphyrin-III C-methyltransferase